LGEANEGFPLDFLKGGLGSSAAPVILPARGLPQEESTEGRQRKRRGTTLGEKENSVEPLFFRIDNYLAENREGGERCLRKKEND